MRVSVAHSPDSDDYFLFWALREKLIPWGDFEFEFETHDTAALNSLARDGIPDIVAISAAAFPSASANYRILSSGASVGRGFGPQLVAFSKLTSADLVRRRIGVPGKSTTAGHVLRQLLPEAVLVEIPIVPFERVYAALETGDIAAAVLIHEGQMDVESRGLHSVVDLGLFWQERMGLPLPLGINCVKRQLGDEVCRSLNKLAAESVRLARERMDEVLPYLVTLNKARGASVNTPAEIRRYLERYANSDSEQLSADVVESLRLLLDSTDFQLRNDHFIEC